MRTAIPSEKIAGKNARCEGSDGSIYGIPLREPVIELRAKDITDKKKLEAARSALRRAVEVERQNITHNHHLKIFVSQWFTDIVPNDVSQFRVADGIAYNGNPNAHIGPLLTTLWTTSLVLALNLQAQRNQGAIERLAPVFRLFGRQDLPADLLGRLPKEVVEILSASNS